MPLLYKNPKTGEHGDLLNAYENYSLFMRYVKKIIKKEKYVVHMLSNGVEFNRASPELGKTPNSGLNLLLCTITGYPAIKRGGRIFSVLV